MSIKKKLGLGVASAALGLSLIGGGTWAAFNDIETMTNSFTAGVLDLGIDGAATGQINVSKLVPGDKIKRTFKITNNGNVDIDKVYLTTVANFTQGARGADGAVPGNSNPNDFLKQFKITVYKADGTDLLKNITTQTTVGNQTYKSLYDFAEATKSGTKFNITTGNGLPNKPASDPTSPDFDGIDADEITMELEFFDDQSKTNGEYNQNKYMGNGVVLDFTFEATQKQGVERTND
ncbi:spore coat protein [Cytobacillus depressus]|uniref:Spore coat protein n=1 Tax=Cytobacillus depressus TaxID=1602942 RepID=A0A6L3V4Q3_9BACI|nr:TasA family protein [Cytobacillus depressus]KAB2336089.1 spore coat protein [Cytobacillus depressus]